MTINIIEDTDKLTRCELEEHYDALAEEAKRLEKERKQLLAMLDEAGSRYEDDPVASLRRLIDDTNRQQKAVIDAAKSCGIDVIDPGEAAEVMAAEVLEQKRRAAGAMAKAEALEGMLSAAESNVHALQRQRLELIQHLAVESVKQ